MVRTVNTSKIKQILIIHPEGNIFNNPSIYGIIEILSEEGYNVEIFTKAQTYINQTVQIDKAKLYFETDDPKQQTIFNLVKYFKPYSWIIGVDLGIIEAAQIAEFQKTNLAYISYEIFFEDEITADEKKIEIEACKNIKFAVVQDKIRGELLAAQNKIPIEKLIYIPVAGRKVFDRKKNTYLHKKLGISEEKKIAIIIGSVTNWTFCGDLIDEVNRWPDNWVLVLHNRYGTIWIDEIILKKAKSNKRVFISFDNVLTTNDLNQILNSVELGLAFYFPNYNSKYTGKNIEHIGLSSGKIATYLANGVPIITNLKQPYSKLLQNYNFGMVVNNFSEIASKLNEINFSTSDCYDFFNHYLNLENKKKKLLDILSQNISISQNEAYNINGFGEIILQPLIKNIEQSKIEITNLTNLVEKIRKSISYRLGNFLVKRISFLKSKK